LVGLIGSCFAREPGLGGGSRSIEVRSVIMSSQTISPSEISKGQNEKIPKVMNVVRIDEFGGPEVVHVAEAPVPEQGPGELLVKIQAASVNPVDYKIRSGKYPAVQGDKLPYTLGRDLAGVVVACVPGETGFSIGEDVYAYVGIERGCYGEFVVVKDSEACRKPSSIEYTVAAGVPLAGITAWQGLFRHGGLQSGQTVLIHGGSGGVGHLAVQFAKAKGAKVITTVSTKNVEFAQGLGADQVIDYKIEKFEEVVDGVDLVFDLIGGETQDRSWAVLKAGGVLVCTVQEPSQEQAKSHGVRAMRYTAEPSGPELCEIAALIDRGLVIPHISKLFFLREAASAIKLVESGNSRGKVVLTVP